MVWSHILFSSVILYKDQEVFQFIKLFKWGERKFKKHLSLQKQNKLSKVIKSQANNLSKNLNPLNQSLLLKLQRLEEKEKVNKHK
jgi:hypothetical protein